LRRRGGRGKRKTLGGKNASKGFRGPQARDRAAVLFGVGARYVQAAKFTDRRPGNVYSAEQWDEVLLPEIER
jgi:hypothetical protein